MGRRVAPDRGYAWVVLAASVGCNYLSGVLVYFVGVIHVELLDKFQEDVTITSWAGSIYSSLQMLAAPLASWVVNRYSCRASVMAGGVLLCVGFVTSSFVTSVGQLVVTYGLIAGTGLGLIFPPSLMIVTYYFERFRSLASGISISGFGLGILSGTLLTQTFIDEYTLRGAFLIIAGLGLQNCVFGMLYRPTEHEGTAGGKRRRHTYTRQKQNLDPEQDVSAKDSEGKGPEETQAFVASETTTISYEHSAGAANVSSEDAGSAGDRSRSPLTQFLDKFGAVGSLLNNGAFVLHCASVCFGGVNMSGVNLHLPEYAITRGTATMRAAALFVAVGVFSLLSRIVCGLLLMSPRVNALVVSVVLLGVNGLASCLFPWYSATYVGQLVFSSLYGLSVGGFYMLINMLIIMLVDFQHLAPAYGMLIFMMGAGYLAGPPVSGLIVDTGGTYGHVFLFLGVAIFLSAAFDLAALVFHRRKTRQLKTSVLYQGTE